MGEVLDKLHRIATESNNAVKINEATSVVICDPTRKKEENAQSCNGSNNDAENELAET